ncbi:MAG: nucleotidyl transferase AbiEii/AbiGii toxin family protein [Gammaproteobacteria bacterium]|nr:nucleotidyl transferase AbiEii/AbiGii toxin family protein [Gammaproteobacteria bacterium]
MPDDFMALAEEIIERKGQLAHCRKTVEKEILHMEILRAMSQAGILRNLVFKGGTCLRLCRGAERLSEDLDFSGGPDFDPNTMADLETHIAGHLRQHYGLEATVRSIGAMSGHRPIHRWWARIVTRPPPARGTSNIGVQRIKIEVDSVRWPTGTSVVPATFPHGSVIMPSAAVAVRCVPVVQTMADKLVALPLSIIERHNPRFRDIWDIHKFMPVSAEERRPIIEAAREDATSRMGLDEFKGILTAVGERLPAIIASNAFRDTLRTFLPMDVAARTVDAPDYREALTNQMTEIFAQLRDT